MGNGVIKGVRIAGLASSVPKNVQEVAESPLIQSGQIQLDKILASTGVERRHIATPLQCTSNLCEAAARRLLIDLAWEAASIDLLIVITQTPDYVLPPTSCVLQERLKIGSECACFDVNLGCSGYVYGLWLASHLMVAGGAKRALILVGDTISKIVSDQDSAVAFLFGDAGTATALEICDETQPWYFQWGSDGRGAPHLIVPAGGFRTPCTAETSRLKKHAEGHSRSLDHLWMEGGEVFSFTLKEVVALIQRTLDFSNASIETVDYFIPHQANLFMLKHLQKRLKVPDEKWLIALRDFGNTSSASIPLTMTFHLSQILKKEPKKVILAGFGVGFSWASVALILYPEMVMSALVILEEGGALV